MFKIITVPIKIKYIVVLAVTFVSNVFIMTRKLKPI